MLDSLREALHGILHLDNICRSNMASARREDLRTIWESISLSCHLLILHVCLFKHRALLWSGKREDDVKGESVVRFPDLRCDFRVSWRTRAPQQR